MSVTINKDVFGKRIKKLYTAWRVSFTRQQLLAGPPYFRHTRLLDSAVPAALLLLLQEHKEDIWDGSNVLAVMAGSASEDLRYLKSVSLHLWLFGYEVTGEDWLCSGCPHALIQLAGCCPMHGAPAAVIPAPCLLHVCLCRHPHGVH